MTRDDIIRLALEAGLYCYEDGPAQGAHSDVVCDFAAQAAAAPYLLAALKKAMPYLQRALDEIGGIDEYNAHYDAEVAINKATGLEP